MSVGATDCVAAMTRSSRPEGGSWKKTTLPLPLVLQGSVYFSYYPLLRKRLKPSGPIPSI